MENWFEIMMSNPELLEDFYAKVDEEISEENEHEMLHRTVRGNAWVRNRSHREKMVRKFLFLNPGMKIEDIYPLRSLHAVFLNDEFSTNGGIYNINHVSHVYVAPGGHLEVFRGELEWGRTGNIFGIGSKDRDIAAITNRRIRHMNDDSNMKYSDYKKKYTPKKRGIL